MHKVSVIMPAYNASKTIADSITSVINQTYKNWELLVINDGSNDTTEKIVSEFMQSDSRIKLLNLNRNGGLSNARNEGVKNSSGEYIAFLDSDDLWMQSKLSCQVDFHTAHKDFYISHTDFNSFHTKGVIKRPWKNIMTSKSSKQGYLLPTLYSTNVVGVLTVMMKKTVFLEVNGFDHSLWTFEDQDLWIRIAEKGNKFGYIDKELSSYRAGALTSISQTLGKYKKAKKKLMRKYPTQMLSNNLAWGNYYRHFGTAYHKRGQYKLSQLYFLKSLRYHKFSFISITTLLYMIYNCYQHLTDNNRRRN